MSLRHHVAATDLDALFGQTEAEIATANTAGVNDAVQGLKGELREITRAAGLGNRLAGAWQGRTYPSQGNSLDPAGYIYSKAPELADAYGHGAAILPLGGRKYLAVPTGNVPTDLRRRAALGRKAGRVNLVALVEARFGKLRLIMRGGKLYGLVDAVAAKNKRGFRPASKGRVAQGRQAKPILMFVFTPVVTVRKRMDPDAAFDRWAARVPDLIAARLANPVREAWEQPGMVMLDSGKLVSRSSLPRYSGPPVSSSGFTPA